MPIIQVELSLHLLLVGAEVVVEVVVADKVVVEGGQHQSQGSLSRAPTNVQALPWGILHTSSCCPPHH